MSLRCVCLVMPRFPKQLQVLPLLTDFKGKIRKKGLFSGRLFECLICGATNQIKRTSL